MPLFHEVIAFKVVDGLRLSQKRTHVLHKCPARHWPAWWEWQNVKIPEFTSRQIINQRGLITEQTATNAAWQPRPSDLKDEQIRIILSLMSCTRVLFWIVLVPRRHPVCRLRCTLLAIWTGACRHSTSRFVLCPEKMSFLRIFKLMNSSVMLDVKKGFWRLPSPMGGAWVALEITDLST